MNDTQLIANQQRQIAGLQDRLRDYEDAADTIRSIIYCIGGPLNDNRLGYSRQQMVDFDRIAKALPR